MKHPYILCLISLFLFLGASTSCRNESSNKPNQAKVDSLSNSVEEKSKHYEDSINKVINSMDDSEIINDPNGPGKSEK